MNFVTHWMVSNTELLIFTVEIPYSWQSCSISNAYIRHLWDGFGWEDWIEDLMGDFKSTSKRLRIEDFQSFDKGFGFLDFLDLIEDFFQPLC